jgi:hypothetical protein
MSLREMEGVRSVALLGLWNMQSEACEGLTETALITVSCLI